MKNLKVGKVEDRCQRLDLKKNDLFGVGKRSKFIFHVRFHEGLVQRDELDRLNELVDTAMDKTPMDLHIIEKGLTDLFDDPWYMSMCYGSSVFHFVGSFLLYRHHRNTIESGYAFISALQHTASLSFLKEHKVHSSEIITIVADEFKELQGKVTLRF